MIRSKEESSGPVIVDLTGPEGNSFVLLGYARNWSKQLGLEWNQIKNEMTSGDYENLLSVLEKYFGEYIILER